MPKKRQVTKGEEAKSLHFERVTLERVLEIVDAGVIRNSEAGRDSVVAEGAARRRKASRK